MKLLWSVFAAIVISLCYGCSQKKFQATFYLDRSVIEEGRDGRDPGVETTNAVIRSEQFWARYVVPKLPVKLDEKSRVRNSIYLSLGKGRDGALSEVTLSAHCSSEQEFAQVLDAIIEGLNQYLVTVSAGKGASYIRKPSRP